MKEWKGQNDNHWFSLTLMVSSERHISAQDICISVDIRRLAGNSTVLFTAILDFYSHVLDLDTDIVGLEVSLASYI